MTISFGNILEKGSRFKKLLAISATTLIATVALATPAWAQVADGKTITVFPDRDIVGAMGYEVNDAMTIQVFRNGVKIGEREAQAADLGVEGVGFEVNHLGLADDDCWTGVTPDIMAGDEVVVTVNNVETTRVIVPTVSYDPGFPVEVTATNLADFPGAQVGDVILEGTALNVDGNPADTALLASLARIQPTPRYRVAPNFIDPLVGGKWRATFRAPYNDVENRDGLNDAQKKQAILDSAHEMVLTPNLQETYIAENGEPGGPAIGCEATAPRSANAVTALDDQFVNIGSGDLAVGGTAIAATTAVSVSVSDGTKTATRDVAAADLQVAPNAAAGKTWTVTIPRNDGDPNTVDLDDLADGKLTVSGAYTDGGGTGSTKSIQKDTAAPTFEQNLVRASGTYTGAFGVSLNTNDSKATVFYTTNGTDPATSNSRVRYQGGEIRINTGQTTFRAVAFDAVNNKSAELSRAYTVNAPQPVPQTTSVGLNVSASTIKLNSRKAISGRVTPANSGSFATLKIVRPGADLIRRLPLSGGAFSFSYKATVVGTHRVSVSFPQDADSKGSTSAVKTFRVIR